MGHAAIRSQLEKELAGLMVREEKIGAHLHGADGRAEERDDSERANLLENDDVLAALDDSTRARIRAIRAALARIDAGHYGVCARCEEPIPVRRLEALPFATRCVGCAD